MASDQMTRPGVGPRMREDDSIAQELVGRYTRGPRDLQQALDGMNEAQLKSRPIAGKWSTLEVLCHLADTEQFFADRIKRTASLDRPLLLGVDASRYVDALHYNDRDAKEEFDLVVATRTQMGRILGSLSPEAWERTAVHSETGLVTLRQLVLNAINHLNHHLAFVLEKRKAMGLSAPRT